MRKIFTLFLGVLFASVAFGQKPSDVIKKTDTKPVIDGVLDEGLWDEATVNAIDLPYGTETPTLGESGETTWRALWDDDGIYVFVTVTDDVYVPIYTRTGAGYMYDKVEIYFDTNYILEDGLGAQTDGNGNGNGHYQFANDIKLDDGTMTTRTDGGQYAFMADDPNWTAEYFIPFTKLITGEGGLMDKTQDIGFDVTISDNDAIDTPDNPVRMRAVWSNNVDPESWVSMDDCGTITLEGAEPPIDVQSIALSVDGNITEDGQTLQIVAEILPEDATNKTLRWTILEESTAKATISSGGLVTPTSNGDLVVQAWDVDEFIYSNIITISISNQKPTLQSLSIVKNGYFDLYNETTLAATSWGGWVDGVYGDPATAGGIVTDGVVALNGILAHETENWHYQFNQNNLQGLPDVPYVVSFVAWAANDRLICFDFEDTEANNYNRYGISSDPESNDRSEWTFPITTVPTRYTFNVIFDQIVPTTNQKIQFMISQDVGTVYLDSITVVTADEWIATPVIQNSIESFKVYPNPVSSRLYVDLSSANTTVAIYNSVGIKMEETVVTGTHHVFDVSRYSKGLYFVKANSTVVKFVR